MLTSILQYGFALRAFEAGIIMAIIAPLIGIFLVLRRYSLIPDTLSHVSLAGIAVGILFGFDPVLAGIAAAVIGSIGIERLRLSKKIFGESALAIFLSGSLALAVIILGLARGLNSNILNYLFGSIVTVTQTDVLIIGVIAVVSLIALSLFYKEFVYTTFDEESAKVQGIPTRFINFLLIILSALTVAVSIPIVGVLLIAALIVIPVLGALQIETSFGKTIIFAEAISLFSVMSGIVASFYLNISTGGAIVFIMLLIFVLLLAFRSLRV